MERRTAALPGLSLPSAKSGLGLLCRCPLQQSKQALQLLFQPPRLRPLGIPHIVPQGGDSGLRLDAAMDKCQSFPPFWSPHWHSMCEFLVPVDCVWLASLCSVYLAASHPLQSICKYSRYRDIHRASASYSRYCDFMPLSAVFHY